MHANSKCIAPYDARGLEGPGLSLEVTRIADIVINIHKYMFICVQTKAGGLQGAGQGRAGVR